MDAIRFSTDLGRFNTLVRCPGSGARQWAAARAIVGDRTGAAMLGRASTSATPVRQARLLQAGAEEDSSHKQPTVQIILAGLGPFPVKAPTGAPLFRADRAGNTHARIAYHPMTRGKRSASATRRQAHARSECRPQTGMGQAGAGAGAVIFGASPAAAGLVAGCCPPPFL